MTDDASDLTPLAPDLVARTVELERQLAEMESLSHSRIARAELKAEAIRAGMIDLDGLKLLDMTKIKIDEAGEVVGAHDLMRDLRRAKPWMFGAPSTSSIAGAPPAQPPKARPATEMNFDEWQKARAELLKRR